MVFMTAALTVSGYGIPWVLFSNGIIAAGAAWLTIAGNTVIFSSILACELPTRFNDENNEAASTRACVCTCVREGVRRASACVVRWMSAQHMLTRWSHRRCIATARRFHDLRDRRWLQPPVSQKAKNTQNSVALQCATHRSLSLSVTASSGCDARRCGRNHHQQPPRVRMSARTVAPGRPQQRENARGPVNSDRGRKMRKKRSTSHYHIHARLAHHSMPCKTTLVNPS